MTLFALLLCYLYQINLYYNCFLLINLAHKNFFLCLHIHFVIRVVQTIPSPKFWVHTVCITSPLYSLVVTNNLPKLICFFWYIISYRIVFVNYVNYSRYYPLLELHRFEYVLIVLYTADSYITIRSSTRLCLPATAVAPLCYLYSSLLYVSVKNHISYCFQ